MAAANSNGGINEKTAANNVAKNWLASSVCSSGGSNSS